MRILFISLHPIPHVGGKSVHVTNLMAALERKGHHTDVVSIASIPNWIRITLVSIPARIVRSFRRDIASYYYTLGRMHLVSSWLWIRRRYYSTFTVASCQDPYAVIACMRALPRLPIVLTMHSYIGLEATLDEGCERTESTVYVKRITAEKNAIRRTQSIVCVDTRIQNHVCTEVPDMIESVHRIMNFLDTDVFKPLADSTKDEIRRKYGLTSTQRIILCPRRLAEKNGVIHAVQAMTMVKNSQAILVLSGSGPQEYAIQAFIEANGLHDRVRLLGDVPNNKMSLFYNMAEIVVIPSITVNGLQEATSLSALEAMSCAKPVIASDIGGLAELIEHEETGILVPEQDPEGIALWFNAMLADSHLANTLGQCARQYVINHHSSNEAADSFLAIFEGVVRG